MADKDKDDGRRKTSRENAGKPPDRLGEVAPSKPRNRSVLDRTPSATDEAFREDNGERKSPDIFATADVGEDNAASSKSSASTILPAPPSSAPSTKSATSSHKRKKLAQLRAEEEIARLRQEAREKELHEKEHLIKIRQEIEELNEDSDSDEDRSKGILHGLSSEEKLKLQEFTSVCKQIGSYPATAHSSSAFQQPPSTAEIHPEALVSKTLELTTQLAYEKSHVEEALARERRRFQAHQAEVAALQKQLAEHKSAAYYKTRTLEKENAAKELELQEVISKAKQATAELELRKIQDEQDEIDQRAIEDDLTERLMKLGVPSTHLSTAVPKTATVPNDPPPTTPTHTSTSPLNPMEQMAHAMTVAFEKMSSRNTDTSATERLLARQSHGKDLPYFNGRPEEWLSFLSSYESSSKECGFSNAANYQRLQKCLKGDALKLVQCMMTTPDNVPAILKTLKLRFGQPENIIESLMEKAKSFPSFKEDKVETQIEFGTAVRNLVVTIQALKQPSYLFNPALVKELEMKMPIHFRREWGRQLLSKPGIGGNLEEFHNWLEAETLIAFRMCPPSYDKGNKGPEEKGKRRDRVLVVAEESPDPKAKSHGNKNPKPGGNKKKHCVFCNIDGHNLQECRKFEKESPAARYSFASERRLCFGCMNGGHNICDCKSKKPCGKDGCKILHHPLIHYKKVAPLPQVLTVQEGELMGSEEPCGQMKIVHLADPKKPDDYFYHALPVTLQGPNGEIKIHAMLDDGSRFTLLDAGVARLIGLKGKSCNFSFSGFGDNATKVVPSNLVDLVLRNERSGSEFFVEGINTYENLSLPEHVLEEDLFRMNPHLTATGLKPHGPVRVQMLIGNPQYDLMLQNRIAINKRNPKAPVGIRCKLGWCVAGPIPNSQTKEKNRIHLISSGDFEDVQLHHLIKDHFTTEDFGVKILVQKPRSREDQRALTLSDELMKKVNGTWETGLLWKKDDVKLPESRTMALKRLYSVERKLDRDPEYASKYVKNIDHYLEQGYIKKVPKEEIVCESSNLWYLPHFAVSKPHKPGKIRLVFDAAAKSGGTSLNNNLLTGPDLVNPLPSVLAKFRQRRIALTGDIKEMFHRVNIRKEDQISQRLLWRGMNRSMEPEEYYMSVMTFGAACSPYCAQEAKNRNAMEHAAEFPEAVEAILKRFYVDNYLDSFDTLEEAYQMYEQISIIHERGNFCICYWTTNVRKLAERIPVDARADTQKCIESNLGELSSERILGLLWDPNEDVFTYTINLYRIKEEVRNGERVPTKREALSAVMSVFDPMGFVAPLTIKAKILLQDAWRKEIGWDDPLPPSVEEKWKSWLTGLKKISEVKIPRCYSEYFSSSSNIQLHVFCDASESAFSAAAYFRIEKDYNINVSLVMAKSKVAPLKAISIPRMELQAAVLGSRLLTTIHQIHEIPIHKNFLWTDSRIVMAWLCADGKQFLQFVSHRIGEIQEATDVTDWHWIAGKDNVADEATRDVEECSLLPNSRWITGPAFLYTPVEAWTMEQPKKLTKEEDFEDPERKKGLSPNILAIVKSKPLIDASKFSNWHRLIRSTATMLRAITRMRQKKRFSESLSVDELEAAEMQWWRWSQQQSYPKEYYTLKKKLPLEESPLNPFSPFMDEQGVIRMRGRVQANVDVGGMERNPVILHPKHPYTVLLIHNQHLKASHHGQERVVNELHQRYCIPTLRVAVRRCWNNCQECKLRKVMPVAPEMGEIPKARFGSRVQPFTFTGVDYFGPYMVAIGRRHEKRYGCLFTCLTTRAVHLEIAHSLSTDSFLMALRRFISRRGSPREIYSDNGTNFVGANNELKECLMDLDNRRIRDDMANKGIKWHFIPPLSPHMGGSWERLVRTVKVALDSIMTLRVPKEEVLLTLMTEVESMLNGRPLTHVSNDPDDLEALTPNHFLIGSSGNVGPIAHFEDKDLFRPKEQWKIAQRLADHFWTRWLKEYLSTLRKRGKWIMKTKPVKVGDLVVVDDEDLPRKFWRMGRISEIFPGPDGQVRQVKVKTATKEYTRPVTRIAVLDVFPEELISDSQEDGNCPIAQVPGGSMSSKTPVVA